MFCATRPPAYKSYKSRPLRLSHPAVRTTRPLYENEPNSAGVLRRMARAPSTVPLRLKAQMPTRYLFLEGHLHYLPAPHDEPGDVIRSGFASRSVQEEGFLDLELFIGIAYQHLERRGVRRG